MFMVLDVETTFKEVNGRTNPSPFVEGNKLVSIGLQKFRTDISPVGKVHIATANDDITNCNEFNFNDKGRDFIRLSSVYEALKMVFSIL